jgi:peptidoglycan hydrolase-like protein with peptidoglycan-binding domain
MPAMRGWALDDEATRATLKGLPGVAVGVGDLAAELAPSGVTTQRVQTAVERQLRRTGIPVFASTDADLPSDVAFLTVSVSTLRHDTDVYAYAVDLAVYQTAALARDPTPRALVTWAVGSIGLVAATDLRAILTTVDRNVAQFIEAYRAVNPRATAEGGRQAVSRARIRQAQKRLQAAGQAPGPIDGWPGPQTRAALRQYQQRKGLRVTGTLDAQTLKALGVQ